MAFESLGFHSWCCFEGPRSLTTPGKVGAVEGRIVLVEILEVLPNPRTKRRDRNHARVEEPQLGRWVTVALVLIVFHLQRPFLVKGLG